MSELTSNNTKEITLKIDRGLFNDVYYPYLFDYSHRWNFYYGSAGSGKSVFIAQKLLIKAFKYKRRILVVRRYGTTIRQSVFQLFKDILAQFKMIEYCKILDSTFYIQLPNGSEIIFMGADDEYKLLSIQDISDVFVEEATETSKDFLEQLNLRMRGTAPYPQIHLAFNPVSTTNFMYEFMEINPPRDSFILKTTYKDNKFLAKDYVEALEDLRRTNPRKAKVFCDGEWGSTGMLVFEDNWEVRKFDVKELLKKGLEVRFGGDFGFSLDPTVILGTIYDKENETIYVFDELYQRGMTNPEIAEWVKSKNYHKQRIFFDSAEPKSITELNRLGILAKPAGKGKDSIKFGIAFLQRHHLVIDPECRNLINELRDYQYMQDKQTGEYIPDKFVGLDHAIDALRYAYSDIYKSARLKSVSKLYLGL
jgi:phage terminase large subunit